MLPERLIRTIQQITPVISKVMRTEPASIPHEGERPKKKECWEHVRLIESPVHTDEAPRSREYTRQDWQAALTSAESKRNKYLRERLLFARKLVQTGKAAQNRETLAKIMQEAIEKGFNRPLS